ncbi:TetR family transcriptional regulator [Microbacterium sp.]|uniref:TetR/AcrR family transcriptional regulator n=1 Tax=Microbacterium sp. TaxID=51671 RepID=UPI002609651B|nr:TetR family transcriptional regulator [Microbacterium sp.]
MQPIAEPRTGVVAAALELFQHQGFDQTSVEQIARAAGVSRSTFFRQFGGKEDVVFVDHEMLLSRLRAFLAEGHSDPWDAVCQAAQQVFAYFLNDPELARLRYQVVRQVPALREREIVTVFRYERLFDEYLRRALPGIDPLDAVGFAALVTAVHNHVLRQLLRGTKRIAPSVLQSALDDARRRYGVLDEDAAESPDDVVVAVFPRAMPIAEVSKRLQAQLDD